MPSQQEVKWSQLKVGIIVLVSLGLLSTLLFLMTSASGMSPFSRKLMVHTYFANSGGLKPGAPVNLQGVTIGEVKTVRIQQDAAHKLTPVEVVMKLDPRYHDSIRTDSRTSIAQVGLVGGDTAVEITSDTAVGQPVADGAELRTMVEPSLQDVIKSSQGTVESLNAILAKLDAIATNLQQGKGSAGALLNDPTLYNRASDTIGQLQLLASNLNHGRGSVGKLLTDDTLYDRLNDSVNKLDQLTTGLSNGKGSAGKLLTDDRLYENLNATLAHANSLLAEADKGQGALGMMLKDPAFAAKLNDTMTQANTLLASVNSGKGTLGKLANDDQAYQNLNKLLVSSNDLVTTIRQDPKKYLTIHMKIF